MKEIGRSNVESEGQENGKPDEGKGKRKNCGRTKSGKAVADKGTKKNVWSQRTRDKEESSSED